MCLLLVNPPAIMSSKFTSAIVLILLIVSFVHSTHEYPMDRTVHSGGPFKIKMLNDFFKACLTIQKIIIDVMDRNVADREALKSYLRQVYAPVLKIISELMQEYSAPPPAYGPFY